MTNRFKDASIIAITILFLGSFAQAQNDVKHKELPNFFKINDRLYRGGQPRKGGIKKLSELGIKTIINLRRESDETRAERKEAEAAGIKYFHISMSSLGRPSDVQVTRALEIIDQSENHPVFIHCKRGSDRTGTVIAAYRISRDGWGTKEALDEAKRNGMRWIQFAKKDYINDYHQGLIGHSQKSKDASGAYSSSTTIIHTEKNFGDRFGRGMSAVEYSLDQTRQALVWFFRKAASSQ
jgi:protein tyrosine/serine phosphatase